MPRSVEEILKHSDELARRFEEYDPRAEDERLSPVEAALREAISRRAAAEREVLDAVRNARAVGVSWASIGHLVGTSGEAARQRYSRLCA